MDGDQWVTSNRWMDLPIHLTEKHPSFGAISWNAGWFSEVTLGGDIVDNYPNRSINPNAFYRSNIEYFATSVFVVSREVFDSTDGFDVEYDPTCFEDTDISF